jgi:macrolide-specific efflux system membrane fusion protein
MKNNKPLILGIVFVVLAGGFYFFKGRAKSSSKDVVRIVKAQTGDIRVTISSPGSVRPKNRLEIKPPVNGRIEKVMIEEGQKVKAGETLVLMSSTDRAALLDAARGQGDETLKYWQEVYKSIPLISPIDGEVIVGTIQPGQSVTTAEAVIVLSDRLIVRAQVDETDIAKIKMNQRAVVTLDAYPDTRIDAVVDHIYYESQTVNNVTVYEVDLKLNEVPEFFRSGMNTNVEFVVEEKKDVLLIPNEVVRRRNGQASVFLHGGSDAQPEERTLTLGVSDDKNVEVKSGLSPNDEIMVRTKKYALPKSASGTNPFMPNRSGGSGGRRN